MKTSFNPKLTLILAAIPIGVLLLGFYVIPPVIRQFNPDPLTINISNDSQTGVTIFNLDVSNRYNYGLVLSGWLLGLFSLFLINKAFYLYYSSEEPIEEMPK